MKILQYRQGLLQELKLPSGSGDNADDTSNQIQSHLRRFVKKNGNIDSLTVDFCGQYVPVLHKKELRLLAALMAAYYSQDGKSSLHEDQVSGDIRYELYKKL